MKVVTQLAVVALLAGAGAGAWHYKDRLPFLASPPAQSGTKSGGIPPVAVEVAPVRQGEIKVTIESVGTARADEAVTITTKVTGLVNRIAFQEGQKVTKDDVLVELDSVELQSELAEKRAERDNARQLLARAKKLLETRNVPEARVDELTASLAAAEARVKADEARLAEYVIRAPFSGRLGLRKVSVGALVEPGDAITTLDDVTPIKVDFDVPEAVLGRLTLGQSITAKSVARPDDAFVGKVVTIDSRVDPVTRTITVRAEIANDSEHLKPGMFLSVTMVSEVRHDALLVPEEALVSTGTKHFVFAVVGDKSMRTEVTLGERQPGEVEVRDGLEPGMLVVVGGLQKVRHGAPVRIVERGATS